MSGTGPLVSCVIPAGNAEAFVAQAIQSVLDQTYQPLECIVVDDGSTDGTARILERFGRRIRVVRQSNRGVSAARNAGARAAAGDFVAFLDADDLWDPTKTERQMARFAAEPGLGLVYCALRRVDESGSRLSSPAAPDPATALRQTLLLEPPFVSVAQTGVVPRTVFLASGGFDERLSVAADSDLTWRLACAHPIAAVAEPLASYRCHPAQMHLDRAAFERDTKRMFDKAFRSPELPLDLRALERRARTNLSLALVLAHGPESRARALTSLAEAMRLSPWQCTRWVGAFTSVWLLRLVRRRLDVRSGTEREVVFFMPTASPLLRRNGPQAAAGAETQMFTLAAELARRGRAVGMVAFAGDGELSAQVAGVDVIPLSRPHIQVPILRTLLFYARTTATLRRTPGATFVQMGSGIFTVLTAVPARLLGRRFVYATAGLLDFERGGSHRGWVGRLVDLSIRRADALIVQSDEQIRLCRPRFGREPLLIKSIAPSRRLRTAEPEAFLWIGRSIAHKQPLAYIRLARAVPEARFRMIAVDPADADGESMAAELLHAASHTPNLELLAPRPQAALAPLIERAVAIVSTSRSEGMPNVFLEGWSQGVPALALHHDPDGVIERDRLGEFAAGSPEQLAVLARAMWLRRTDQAELGARCQDYVRREHSLDRVADRWLDALQP
ncbi:MAG: glycosyltransferase [Solirubrobacteraceae bacterium]